MRFSRQNKRRRVRRAGVETLELILVTPIVVILLVAILQFGSVHIVQEAITHSTTVGAREAAKGAPIEQVAGSIQAVLEPHGIEFANPVPDTDGSTTYTAIPNSGVRVIIEYGPEGLDKVVEYFGDPSVGDMLTSPADPELAAPEVRVTVRVKLDKTPIFSPATLNRFGFTFPGDRYEVRAIARLE